jgi:DNA-binding IclR family transcriptional regulator
MLRSLEKVFVLLDAFTPEAPEWSLADLSRHVGMAKPTVHHIMSTLIKGGWIERDPGTKRLRLGIRLWEKGWLAVSRLGVREVARPFLEALVDDCGETSRLSILDNVDPRWVIYMDRIESRHAVRAAPSVEVRSPSHCVATGKALLAYRPDVVKLLGTRPLRAYTNKTLTESSALQKDLATTRARGYSVSLSEFHSEVVGIAAAIWGHEGGVIAAVGISVPVYRMTATSIRKAGNTVMSTAAEISRRMGYVNREAPRDSRRKAGA